MTGLSGQGDNFAETGGSPIVYAAATWHAYVLQAFFTPALSSPSAAEEREQRERLEDPLRGPSRRALSVRLLTLRPPPRGGRPDHAPSKVRRVLCEQERLSLSLPGVRECATPPCIPPFARCSIVM